MRRAGEGGELADTLCESVEDESYPQRGEWAGFRHVSAVLPPWEDVFDVW